MTTAILGTMIVLLLLGFPMMVPLIVASVVGFVAIFGGIGIVLLGIAVFLERKREAVLQRGREWLGRLDDWD